MNRMRPIRRMMRLVLAAALTLTASAETPGTISLSVPDVVLRDQDGDRVKVWSELIRGKVVVMNFVFTSCTTICSPMGANFGELQSHVGRDVRLISVSIDPGVDTPARLKRWSRQFHAGPSWTLLTGDHEEVERLLKALGVYTGNRFSHAPILLVGDGNSGRWLRGNGLAAPADVMAMIRRVRSPIPAPGGRARR
jgi:protein SCO1